MTGKLLYDRIVLQFGNSAIGTIVKIERIQRETVVLDALILADYRFHGKITGASENSLFSAIYATLRAFMREEIMRTYRDVDIRKGIGEHRELLDTICSADKQKAVALLGKHIGGVREKLKEVVAERES